MENIIIHDNSMSWLCTLYADCCYESVGSGGLAVCTSADGAIDTLVDDDDCWSNWDWFLSTLGVKSCSVSSGVTTKIPGVSTVASWSSWTSPIKEERENASLANSPPPPHTHYLNVHEPLILIVRNIVLSISYLPGSCRLARAVTRL